MGIYRCVKSDGYLSDLKSGVTCKVGEKLIVIEEEMFCFLLNAGLLLQASSPYLTQRVLSEPFYSLWVTSLFLVNAFEYTLYIIELQ